MIELAMTCCKISCYCIVALLMLGHSPLRIFPGLTK